MSKPSFVLASCCLGLALSGAVVAAAAAPGASASTSVPVASSSASAVVAAASSSASGVPGPDAGVVVDGAVVAADSSTDAAAAVDAGSDGASNLDSGAVDAQADAHRERVWASCTENIPEGITPPKMKVTFPTKGTTGHAAILQVVIEHGLGETVFPAGFRVHPQSDAARALQAEHFLFPDPKGPARPNVKTKNKGNVAVTTARLPFVPLPPEPGRHKLTLPPIPISIARANGQVMTLCTPAETITVDEPTANEPNAKPKPNPPPRHQRETWTLLRDITYGVGIGLLAAALIGWLVLKWLRRPRPAPPPPPPRPAWELALEELEAIRSSTLLQEGRLTEYVDRGSDTLRRYLGRRYGFDGIESTTDEVLDELRERHEASQIYDSVRRLLQDGDLVKFARFTPQVEDCVRMINRVEDIVRSTTPRPAPPPGVAEGAVEEKASIQGDATRNEIPSPSTDERAVSADEPASDEPDEVSEQQAAAVSSSVQEGEKTEMVPSDEPGATVSVEASGQGTSSPDDKEDA